MHVDVQPKSLSVIPGQPAVLTVQVINNTQVISGHKLGVLGLDPRWWELDKEQLSLFPDTVGVAVLTITLPAGLPAGTRTISVEVRELTSPAGLELAEVQLTVPAELGLRVGLDPVSVTGGGSAAVGVLVDNTGNSTVDVSLAGADEEGAVSFAFEPPLTLQRPASLDPGERAVATGHLRARRPWFGSPKVRPFTIKAGPAQPPVTATGTWVQRPFLSRGALALLGLLVAVSVFAAVIGAALSRVVARSAADRDLALQIAQANQTGGAAGTLSISGTVTLLTSRTGVGGVTVEVFTAANTASPVASTATAASGPATGSYQVPGLDAGTYKVRFRGAGFTELWYPDSLTPDNAKAVTLARGQPAPSVDVQLGGEPATLSGQVVGADPSGAVVTLELPAPAPAVTTAALELPAAGTTPAASAPDTSAGTGPAVVMTETLDASGAFNLTGIPSPGNYDLVVSKQGYATTSQQVDLGGGEQRTGLVLNLRQGNGSIAGQVSTATGPLGGATISASDGHTTVSTVSVTQGTVGSFTLSNLPTPDTFTVLVSASGFATQTLTLSLTSNQSLSGVAVTLSTGVGSISGLASTADGSPAGGVTVTVTNGQLSLQTVTLSVGAVGTYQVNGLPVPSTYTVTFSRPDLASQTRAVTLAALGNTNITNVNATLPSSTAVLFGTVTQQDGTALGEIAVQLSSGTATYKVTSASVPTPGAYEIDSIQPGTYTASFTRPGGVPTSTIVTVAAGQRLRFDPVLAVAASISGTVVHAVGTGTQPLVGADVRLFQADQYPNIRLKSIPTDANGQFTFANVNAPQNYIVEFAYPAGSPGQLTVEVQLNLSESFVICGTNPAPPPTTTTTVSPQPSCPITLTTG
jgi:hypothetical protein